MASNMKVHAYDVHRHQSPAIEQMFATISAAPINARLRTIGITEMRMEACFPPNVGINQSNYWLMDFTNLRFKNGPGKANRSAPITGFNLTQNDGFGEETALLYDAKKRVILIQYNHHGPRATSIQSYINSFDVSRTHDYEFWIKPDVDALNRFRGKSILKKITAKISPPKISAQQRSSGVSLSSALQIANDLHGSHIEITISASKARNSKLNFQKAREFIIAVQNLASTTGAVEKLEASGKRSIDTPVEPIDLLSEKLEVSIDNLDLGRDLRYTQASRFEGLIRARNGWNSVL